jgi:uncharacterized protein YbjT (DUF2867 family)
MANEENTVLIIGATGTVGREAVRATLARGGKVRALVRSTARAEQLLARATVPGDCRSPALRGVEPVIGDPRDGASLARAFRGVRAALYVSPHEPDEEALAERVVRACEAAGARLVFVGVHIDGSTRLWRAVQRWSYGKLAPHYAPKFRIAERVRVSRTRPILLMPTNYYQNDELFRDAILSGELPAAIERGVNRVDVRDLGIGIARALLEPALPSGAYPMNGPVSLTGDGCAAIWSAALGREVRCVRDRARLEAALAPLPPKKREDFLKTYDVLRGFELKTKRRDVERTEQLIGRPPTPYEQYVRETLIQWQAGASVSAQAARPLIG